MRAVYSYTSYREFLRDFYLFQKEHQEGYSFARFAKEAGIGSANYLKLVMDGKRNLMPGSLLRFAKALRLSFAETEYFEALVNFSQSMSDEEKEYFSKRLGLLSAGGSKGQERKTPCREFVSEWYSPAILFALQGQPQDINMAVIAKKIGIPVEWVRSGIDELKKCKLLQVQDERYFCSSHLLTFRSSRRGAQAQKAYLASQLERSRIAFQARYELGAKFHSHTFTLPRDQFSVIESALHSMAQGIIAKADKGPPEQLAQLNVQFFTLT